jgi:hypothetical protein
MEINEKPGTINGSTVTRPHIGHRDQLGPMGAQSFRIVILYKVWDPGVQIRQC